MKIILALTALFTSLSASAASVTLAWDPSPGTNVIVAYKLYIGPQSRTYTNSISAGNATTITTQVQPGSTTYFAVTALDNGGLESDFSSEVSFTSAPPPVLTATTGTNGIALRWTIAPASAKGYQLALGQNPTGTNYTWNAPISILSYTTTNYWLSSAALAGTNDYVRIRTVFNDGSSTNDYYNMWSAPVDLTPLIPGGLRVKQAAP